MKLNPTEWTRAQELLLRLVDVLKPLENKQNPFAGTPRPFFPFSHSSLFNEGGVIRFGARLLIDLTDAKKEVEDWIGKLPVYSTEPAQENRKEPTPTTNVAKLGLKPDKSGSFSPPALNAKENPSFQKQPASPVENQAQKLIEQVRGAILSLSSSSYLFDPIAEPFCDALKRLKPLIDQLIDAVSREGVQPIGEARESGEARKERFAPSRFKAASSEREILLKGLVSFPKKEQKSRSISPQVERGEEPAKLTKEPLAKTKSSSLFSDSPLTSAKENSSKTTGPIDPVKTTERTSIPSAPYFSSISASFSPRKTKRKRKSFWFREDETSPERDNS